MMKTDKSSILKILVSLLVVLGIIIIISAGYDFGKWIHEMSH